MPGSSASSCTCTPLLLLLPLLLAVHRSSSAALPTPAGKPLPKCFSSTKELNTDIGYLAESVKNCSVNCSLLSDADPCRCLNLTVSQDCGPRDFLLSGLTTLKPRLRDQLTVVSLIRRLTLSADCRGKAYFCSLPVPAKVLVSPKEFQEKMKQLLQQYNAASSAQLTEG